VIKLAFENVQTTESREDNNKNNKKVAVTNPFKCGIVGDQNVPMGDVDMRQGSRPRNFEVILVVIQQLMERGEVAEPIIPGGRRRAGCREKQRNSEGRREEEKENEPSHRAL
jgi:hypothetical protein